MVRPAALRELRLALAAMLAATVAASMASAATAEGAPRKELRQACSADVRTVCAGIFPGGGRLKQCLIEKFDQLSDGCKSALKQVRVQSINK
jgi:hypothetical protein